MATAFARGLSVRRIAQEVCQRFQQQGAKPSPFGIGAFQQCTLEHGHKKILGQVLRVAYRITAVTDESENRPPIVLAELAQRIAHRWIPSFGIGARENDAPTGRRESI